MIEEDKMRVSVWAGFRAIHKALFTGRAVSVFILNDMFENSYHHRHKLTWFYCSFTHSAHTFILMSIYSNVYSLTITHLLFMHSVVHLSHFLLYCLLLTIHKRGGASVQRCDWTLEGARGTRIGGAPGSAG